MKSKTMILMGLAVACGLGASYMTSRLLAERSSADEEKVKIVVAKKNLNIGQRIAKPDELFEYKEVSRDAVPPDAITDMETLKDKSLKQPRNLGEAITPASLRGKGEQLPVPEHHVAMGLKVNLEGQASGFASLPGSRVNVFQTVIKGKAYSQLLLSDVLVLAADINVDSKGELASPAQVVTFALKLEDALKISLAKELGSLSLALSRGDEKLHDTKTVIFQKDIEPKLDKKDSITEPDIVEQTPKKDPPKIEIQPDTTPNIVKGYYDIVSGIESGAREVIRIYWQQVEDGPIEITGRELIESTRVQPNPANRPAPKGSRNEI
jgi:Flp pilus assembly protein CpaB